MAEGLGTSHPAAAGKAVGYKDAREKNAMSTSNIKTKREVRVCLVLHWHG